MENKLKFEEWSAKEIEEACSFTGLINRIYEKVQIDTPKFSFSNHVHNQEEFSIWSKEFRIELMKILGIKEMLDKRADVIVVNSKEDKSPNIDNEINKISKKMKKKYSIRKYTMEHFYLKSWMDTLIPVILCKPNEPNMDPNVISNNKKLPAFVCTHGHGQNKAQLVALEDNKRYPNSVWSHDLANMGIITITMDQWGWNERGGLRYDGSKIKSSMPINYDSRENKFALNMLQFGHTINGLRFFDAIRQVDYLLCRNDVDPNRIGIGGLSLGGTTAGWTMCLDTRINLGIVAGYMNTFKDSIIDLEHCSCNYVPGISNLGEMYDVFSLMAPRPVCFITGKHDSIYPLKSAQKAFSEIKKAYTLFNVEEKCVLDITPLGHGWRGDIAYSFIKKQWEIS